MSDKENANRRIIELEAERDVLLWRMRSVERLLARDGRKMTEQKIRELERTQEGWLERLDGLNGELEEVARNVTYLKLTRKGWVVA